MLIEDSSQTSPLWWYAQGNQACGPANVSALRALYAEGVIDPHTNVWRPGMQQWTPLAEVPELAAQLVLPPALFASDAAPSKFEEQNPDCAPEPPLLDRVYAQPSVGSAGEKGQFGGAHAVAAPKTSKRIASNPQAAALSAPTRSQATTAQRVVARLMDMLVHSVLAAFVLFFAMPDQVIAAYRSEEPAIAMGIGWLSTTLLIEAVLAGLTGNSLGKALVGIRPALAQGGALRFKDWLYRGLGVWSVGFCAGLPLLNLGFAVWQTIRMARGQPASYDAVGGYVVAQQGAAPWRTVLVAMVFFLLFLPAGFIFQHMDGF